MTFNWRSALRQRWIGKNNKRSMRICGPRLSRTGLTFESLENRTLPSVSSVTDNNVAFQTVDQNMWEVGEAAAIHAGFSVDLIDVDFDPVTLGGFVAGTGLEASFSGGFNLGFSGAFDVTGGEVDASYGTAVMVKAVTSSGAAITSHNLTAGDTFILRSSESPDPARHQAQETQTGTGTILAALYIVDRLGMADYRFRLPG